MGNSCVAAGCRGSNKGSSVEPSTAKGGSNQVSDEAPSPAGGGLVSNEPPSPAVQTTFKWSIGGFSSLLQMSEGLTYSSVFRMRGLDWYLKLNPRDTKSGDQNEYVSLLLKLSPDSETSDTVVETTFKFLIYDQLYGKHHEQQVSHNFQKASTCSGISCMISLAALKENSSGFLVNNICVFGVEFISVVIAKANDVSEMLFVQKINNTSSEPQVYTWNIEDFFVLSNPSYSPKFELCGHKWSIQIYPSGKDTNGNYLSLYLVMKDDKLHQNSAILIEQSMSIKSQETGKHLTYEGRNELSKIFNTAGWEKFISLEDFKDPANGYLVKTKCCIEVQVAVIGSSKTK